MVSPYWIIALLSDQGELCNESFVNALDKQFLAWSRINGIEEQWWRIDPFTDQPTSDLETLASSLEKFLKNPRIQAGSGQLSIVLVGDVRTGRTRTFMHSLAKLLQLQGMEGLKGRADFNNVALSIYGLLYLPGTLDSAEWEEVYRFFTQLHTQMSDSVTARRPLDTLFFLQEKNSGDENTNGYLGVSDEDARALMVQALFHLTIGENRILQELREDYQTRYAAIGAAAVFYDWESAQRALAQTLGEDLLARFSTGRDAPFLNQVQAEAVARDVSSSQGITTLYQRLITSPDRPSFTFDPKIWQGAMDRNGRSISPWAFYSKLLLVVYLHTYLKDLPFRVSEYAKAFLHTTMRKFQEFLGQRRLAVWGDKGSDVKGLRATIREAFVHVLQGKHGDARSLGQVILVADEIIKAYDPAKIEGRLASVPEFSRLEVFAVPEFLSSYYEQAGDRLDSPQEEKIYRNFVDQVHRHPMLPALLTQSVMIGFLTSLFGYRLLSLLSPGVVNLEPLLQHPYLSRGLLFLLPIGLAVWRYHFRVLTFLRKQMYVYLGAVLKHAQTQARGLVAQELVDLCNQVEDYCEEVKEWANHLGQVLKYPAEETELYPSTSFQREVFKGFDIPGRPGKAQGSTMSAVSQLDVGNQQKTYEQFSDGEKNLYLRQALDQVEDRVALWELLSETLPPADLGTITEDVGNRWRTFAKKLYEGLSRRQLDGFLDEGLITAMKSLSFPPVSIAAGLLKLVTLSEWKYARNEKLAQLSPNTSVELTTSTSLASLAGYRPVRGLTDISILQSIARDVAMDKRDWSDLPSLFSAATTTQAVAGKFGLTDFATGEFIPLADLDADISKLRQRFGITVEPLVTRGRVVEPDKERLTITDLDLEI